MDNKAKALWMRVHNHLKRITKYEPIQGTDERFAIFIDSRSNEKYVADYKNGVLINFEYSGN